MNHTADQTMLARRRQAVTEGIATFAWGES